MEVLEESLKNVEKALNESAGEYELHKKYKCPSCGKEVEGCELERYGGQCMECDYQENGSLDESVKFEEGFAQGLQTWKNNVKNNGLIGGTLKTAGKAIGKAIDKKASQEKANDLQTLINNVKDPSTFAKASLAILNKFDQNSLKNHQNILQSIAKGDFSNNPKAIQSETAFMKNWLQKNKQALNQNPIKFKTLCDYVTGNNNQIDTSKVNPNLVNTISKKLGGKVDNNSISQVLAVMSALTNKK